MNRLIWWLRRRAPQLALWAGLVLVAVAQAFNWFGVRPLEQRLEVLEQARNVKREGQLARVEDDLARQSSPRSRLASFYGYFARGDTLTDLLAKLYGVSKASGVEMQRAEYRLNSRPERMLDSYQVIVPVRGSYQTIREFIVRALRELPTMSLDQMQFQRKAVGDSAVDAQISFTFHLPK